MSLLQGSNILELEYSLYIYVANQIIFELQLITCLYCEARVFQSSNIFGPTCVEDARFSYCCASEFKAKEQAALARRGGPAPEQIRKSEAIVKEETVKEEIESEPEADDQDLPADFVVKSEMSSRDVDNADGAEEDTTSRAASSLAAARAATRSNPAAPTYYDGRSNPAAPLGRPHLIMIGCSAANIAA